MDKRQVRRLTEYIAAADAAIASAASEPAAPTALDAHRAFEKAYRVVERERFLPPETVEMVLAVYSALLDCRSYQILAEIELSRGGPITGTAQDRWTRANLKARTAALELRSAWRESSTQIS